MMMPANFSAVNAEVVYGGADLFSILADTTAPVWGASNVKTFNTNLLTILSNTFTSWTVGSTMGVMFSGDEGSVHALFNNQFKDHAASGSTPAYTALDGDEMTFGNKVMRALGVAASVYTLGMKDAAVWTAKKVVKTDGTTVA